MSLDAMVWATQVRGLKPATKIVLIQLAEHHNRKTGQCNPRSSVLEYECEMSRSSLFRHLEVLEDAGLIRRKEGKRSDGGQSSNQYDLIFTPREATRVSNRHGGGPTDDTGGVPQMTPPYRTRKNNQENEQPPLVPQGGSHDIFLEMESDEAVSIDEQFESWWKIYPKRQGSNPKRTARAKFEIALRKIKFDELMQATLAFASSRVGEDARFTPQATTWLNQERWSDYLGGDGGGVDPDGKDRRPFKPDDPDHPLHMMPTWLAEKHYWEDEDAQRLAAQNYWAHVRAKSEAAE